MVDGTDPDSVNFGIRIVDENAPPTLPDIPGESLDEDSGVLNADITGTQDSDGDSFIYLQGIPTENGALNVGSDGSITFIPNPDYSGTDSFSIFAHDGRDASVPAVVAVTVNPIPDAPRGISLSVNSIPEDAEPGYIVGSINVNDPDSVVNYVITVDSQRFVARNQQLVFVGGLLDFETEPEIDVTISVNDLDAQEIFEQDVSISVLDANDPITDILPDQAEVEENIEGAEVARLVVFDQDFTSDPTFTVDDNRFIVVNNILKLLPEISLDYEAETEVTVRVTASDGGDSFSQPVNVRVIDVIEQVQAIGLSPTTVHELSPGAEVGEVTIDGNAVTEGYVVAVDDARFEIVDSILKLTENTWVERSEQEEIEVTISARDRAGTFDIFNQEFTVQVIDNPSPYHNEESPFDVDGNGIVSAADALAIINYLNVHGPGPVGFGDPGYGFDVNFDGFVTTLDALLVLNELNRRHNNGGGGTVGGEEPEGEQVDSSLESIAPNLAPKAQQESEQPIVGTVAPVELDGAKLVDNPSKDSQIAIDAKRLDDLLEGELSQEEFTRQVDEFIQSVIKRRN